MSWSSLQSHLHEGPVGLTSATGTADLVSGVGAAAIGGGFAASTFVSTGLTSGTASGLVDRELALSKVGTEAADFSNESLVSSLTCSCFGDASPPRAPLGDEGRGGNAGGSFFAWSGDSEKLGCFASPSNSCFAKDDLVTSTTGDAGGALACAFRDSCADFGSGFVVDAVEVAPVAAVALGGDTEGTALGFVTCGWGVAGDTGLLIGGDVFAAGAGACLTSIGAEKSAPMSKSSGC